MTRPDEEPVGYRRPLPFMYVKSGGPHLYEIVSGQPHWLLFWKDVDLHEDDDDGRPWPTGWNPQP